MSIKERFSRALRANLNELLDAVTDFEKSGGVRQYLDPLSEEFGFDPPPPRTGGSGQKTLRDYYANLEVPFGSDMDTVKDSYKKLMRKYHPDRHSKNAETEALATDLSQEITRAFQAIESYLTTGRY